MAFCCAKRYWEGEAPAEPERARIEYQVRAKPRMFLRESLPPTEAVAPEPRNEPLRARQELRPGVFQTWGLHDLAPVTLNTGFVAQKCPRMARISANQLSDIFPFALIRAIRAIRGPALSETKLA